MSATIAWKSEGATPKQREFITKLQSQVGEPKGTPCTLTKEQARELVKQLKQMPRITTRRRLALPFPEGRYAVRVNGVVVCYVVARRGVRQQTDVGYRLLGTSQEGAVLRLIERDPEKAQRAYVRYAKQRGWSL